MNTYHGAVCKNTRILTIIKPIIAYSNNKYNSLPQPFHAHTKQIVLNSIHSDNVDVVTLSLIIDDGVRY